MDSIKIKMNKLEASSPNKVFRFRKQVGKKYHKVVITDEANLSLVFHLYKSMTVLVLDNMSLPEMTSEIEKLLVNLAIVKQQKVIFIFACGYCSLLERRSSATKQSESCCGECHAYVLNRTLENISKQMVFVKKLVVSKMPKCYFLPVALPPFSFEWHFSMLRGDHQSCCPHLVKELSCFTPSVLSQMQKVLDSVVNNYNSNVNDFCVEEKLPLIEWSKIYLTENQVRERQGIIAKKINSLICDFLHTIYQEECRKELDHVQKALDEDLVVKKEPAEMVDVDDLNCLPFESTPRNEVELSTISNSGDVSKASAVESLVMSSELDANSTVAQNGQKKRKSVVDQNFPAQSKRKRTRSALLPSLNVSLKAMGSSSVAENDHPEETVCFENPSSRSSVINATCINVSIDNQDSDSYSSTSNENSQKSVSGETVTNSTFACGDHNPVLSPDLEVLEEEVQVLGGRSKNRRKNSVQIIDVGEKPLSEVQMLCPMECNNVPVHGKKPELIKKKSFKQKKNSRSCEGSDELMVLGDLHNVNDQQKMNNSTSSRASTVSVDDVASCDSSDYASCGENPDVFCEKVSKSVRKKTSVPSPEVEWVLPLQKQVSAGEVENSEPRVEDKPERSFSSLKKLASDKCDASSMSVDEPAKEVFRFSSKTPLQKKWPEETLTNDRSGLGTSASESRCKIMSNKKSSLKDIVKKEKESETENSSACNVSIFKRTEKAGGVLRVFVTDDRFVELSDVLIEANYNNYIHLSCQSGLMSRFFKPVMAAIKDTVALKMNQKKHLIVGVCLGTVDIVTFLNDFKTLSSGFPSDLPSAVAQKVADYLKVFKKTILKAYPNAFVLFFKIPTFSKEGNLKITVDKLNCLIHDINHCDSRLSSCLAEKCPIVPKLCMSQYVLSKQSVNSWFQVCKWYLKALEDLINTNPVSSSDNSLRNKGGVSKDAKSGPHERVMRKKRRQNFVNEHSNIVCLTPKSGLSAQPDVLSRSKPSTSARPDVAFDEGSESDITVVYTDSDSDTECCITRDDVSELVARVESLLKDTNFENRDSRIDVRKNLLSSNVCALIAVGRTMGERDEEESLLRIARKIYDQEKKKGSIPPSLEAKERKSIILALGTTMKFLEEATLSQAANDLLYTSVFSLKKVYSG